VIHDPGVCQPIYVMRAGCANVDRRPVSTGDSWRCKNIVLHECPDATHGDGRRFDAAFAKLLCPLIIPCHIVNI